MTNTNTQPHASAAGTFNLGGDLSVNRLGYDVCNELTMEYITIIDLVRIDERTRSLVVLYGLLGIWRLI